MKRGKLFSIASSFLLATFGSNLIGQISTAPRRANIDKKSISQFIRYADGISPEVAIVVSDPVGSRIPSFLKMDVTLKSPKTSSTEEYLVSSDGRYLISGRLLDLEESPFADLQRHFSQSKAISIGSVTAPIEVDIFEDFQCPFCAEHAKAIDELVKVLGSEQVKIVHHDFPLEIHSWAKQAAIVGFCIGSLSPSNFWQFRSDIFVTQEHLTPENFAQKVQEFTRSSGLDVNEVDHCVKSKAAIDHVEADIKEGKALGVVETPTSFINGRLVGGALSLSELQQLSELEKFSPNQGTIPISKKKD